MLITSGYHGTHHATDPGYAAYNPVMQRNVPKYFVPFVAVEILMENPTRLMRRQMKRNGERILTWSDHDAKITRKIARVKLRPASLGRDMTTHLHTYKAGQSTTG